MAKVALNKSALNKEKRSLATYNRYLPALELKRQQLMVERRKAEQALREAEQRIAQLRKVIEEQLPMLAQQEVNVAHLVEAKTVRLGTQNIVGCRVPVIDELELVEHPYSYLSRPHWVDSVVVQLKEMLRLKVELEVFRKRSELIRHAARVTSQRVNLFSKILIPEAKENISRIKIYLSDQDRAAVMNAKLSKQKVIAQQQKAKLASATGGQKAGGDA